jgi:predicted permease
MQAIFDVVLPVFGIILTGYLAGRIKLLGPDSSEALNKFCYWFALPPVLFLGPARVPLEQVFNLPFIATFMGGVAITWLIALAVGVIAFRDRPAVIALALLSGTFSNAGYMGIPLFLAAFGPQGVLPAVIATVSYTLLLVATTVIIVEADLAGHGGAARAFVNVLKGLVKSPLIVAPLLGLAFTIVDTAGWEDLDPTTLPGRMRQQTEASLEGADVALGLVKAAAFGFIIAVMGCYQGYRARGGALGVGRAATYAVVSATVLILAVNYVITSLWPWG